MSTAKDMPNVTHMGKEIENITYVGRNFESIMYMDRKIELVSNTNSGLGGSLLDGTMEAGFFGEVTQQELITTKDLINMCFAKFVLDGNTILNENATWLKFAYMNKVEYIPKQPLCNYVALNIMVKNNLVDGSRILTINGIKYRIRLIKGKTEGKQSDTSSNSGEINHYSEWNRLFLPLTKDRNESNYKYPENVEPDRLKWTGRYLEDDFSFYDDRLRWKKLSGAVCQEGWHKDNALVRGNKTVESSLMVGGNQIKFTVGWRPVLEVVDF